MAGPKKFLLTGGRIWTGIPAAPFAEALLVQGSRIVAVGRKKDVLERVGSDGAERLELEGNLVIPGITDAHIHLEAFAKQKNALDLLDIGSKPALLAALREKAEHVGKDEWIYGCRLNETMWPVPVVPTRDDLDSLGIQNPVLLMRVCAHVHVANSRAMRLGGLRTDGMLSSGILNEETAFPIVTAMEKTGKDPALQEALLHRACLDLAEVGITSAHICGAASYGMEEDLGLYQSLAEKRLLPVRILSYHDVLPNLTIRSGFGDEWVCYGGFKIFLDGSLGGRTAALVHPYSDAPKESGMLNHSDEDLFACLEEAVRREVQCQIHAIGDAALDQALRVIEKIQERHGCPRLPFRINHAIVCPPELVEKIKELGVAVDIQASQAFSDRNMAPLRLGRERLAHSYTYRRFFDSGIPVASSSDSPVEDINPWLGIWAGVTRRDGEDYFCCLPGSDETLDLGELLTSYVVTPQEIVGRGNRAGKIAEGYLADFTVLDCDPFSIPRSALKTVKSKYTVVNGALSFGVVKGWPSIGE